MIEVGLSHLALHMSPANPHYPDLERRIGEFLSQVDGRPHRSAAFQFPRP